MENRELSKKKIIILTLMIIPSVTMIITLSVLYSSNISPESDVLFVEGPLTEDTKWSGLIHVENSVVVPENITLTILPGTWVEFRHYRGYKEDISVGLFIAGGTIKAIGSPDQQIWFTSDADSPINGDWAGISCVGTNKSIFKYAIIEFSTIGLEQLDSSVNISHSIVRWVNTEGLYAERSRPIIEYNLIYGNAYHEIALEQYNYDVQIRFNIFKGGHFGIHAEATNVNIEGNYFVNYTRGAVTGGQFSNFTIIGNKFENISATPICLDHTTTNITLNNDFGSGTVPIPILDFPDRKRIELGYIPGDPQDQYLYVYPEIDETRRVVKRLENEITIGSALTFLNGSLWRFNLASYSKGIHQDFIKIDPSTGNNSKFYSNNYIVNPRGLTSDGQYFWVNDFTLRKIFKFKINASDSLEIIDSFSVPNSTIGGLSSLVCDGSFLYSVGHDGSLVYKINFTGDLISQISYQGAPLWGSLTWTGSHFWGYSGIFLTKWFPNWTLAGKIYPPAWGTDALAWDGTYLWSVQKTCELWADGKIFQIEIIDDQAFS
ncbi:MAG: right-handed parallel beta-helix repeat-containing protein [Promethearchaeota archaeon]